MLKKYHFEDKAQESTSHDFYNIAIRDIWGCSENRESAPHLNEGMPAAKGL